MMMFKTVIHCTLSLMVMDMRQFEGDHIRTSSSNPNLMHFESNRTRPGSTSDSHTSGTDSFLSHDQSISDIKIRERFVSKAEKGMEHRFKS
jgi:hypothetical protein